jgi:hypothetical protein
MTLPYSQQYYDILESYLEKNEPTNIIFENFFGKLFCFVQDENYVFNKLSYLIKKFSNIVVDKSMLDIIFQFTKGEREMWPDDIESGYVELFRNKCVIQRLSYVLLLLYQNRQLKITLDNLCQHIKKINLNCHYELTKDILKKLCTKIYCNNKQQKTSLDSLNYLFKYGLLKRYEIKTQEEYELLYKYFIIPKAIENKFKYTIKCLENACEVKNNIYCVKKLLEFIEPTSQCLDNALKFKSNDVVKLLLTRIKPTNEQIIKYCKKYNDDILVSLFEFA